MTDRDARLDAVRREIDAIDAGLLDLLNRRAAAALEVAAVKSRRADPRYYRPERETALLRRLAAGNAGPLPDDEVARLFREIVSTCRAMEQRPVVACATVAGARAAFGHFGGAVDLHVAPNAAGALAAVAATDAVAGTAAVATTGTDTGAGETTAVARTPTPAARARCDFAVIEFSPGGEAAPAVADAAGAGLVLCGEWYAAGGERYVVAGREPVPPTGDDWTSLVVAADRVADLESHCAVLDLAVRSTPIAGRSSSIADVAAHKDDPRLAGLLAGYGGGERTVLGAYPNARSGGRTPAGGGNSHGRLHGAGTGSGRAGAGDGARLGASAIRAAAADGNAMIRRLCIIGAGLIGGSLARDLGRLGQVGEIVGSSRHASNLERAAALGVIDRFDTDAARAVAGADMVVVAAPLGAMAGIFERIRDALGDDAVVTDVGSAKGSVVAAARAGFGSRYARFVPAHPVAGTEHSGVEASAEHLFERRRVILTPTPETDADALGRVARMWEAVGAEVVEMDVTRHDEILAATSHLPHMLAYTLVDVLGGMKERAEIFRFSAGGLRDFTRVASSDPQMWHDICQANRDALSDVLERFGADLGRLGDAVRSGDGAFVRSVFVRAKAIRDRYCGDRR